MAIRPTGRAVFYTRDSGGEHETTPAQYVQWAQRTAATHGARFVGTPEQIERMIRTGLWAEGDVFVDYKVKGNTLSRKGLNALKRAVETDRTISHVLIPRRDRLLRPEEAIEGLAIEQTFHQLGVTLVFMERVAAPRVRGRERIGELIVGLIDYDKAGEDRRQLAQKILYSHLTLARAGYSTGGRPPYGFRRWLVKMDGSQVRQLSDGESVRLAGHHVVWLPSEDEREWAIIRRILELLPTTPASQVARLLTEEKIPPPDAGRARTDNGVTHPTSGVWHQVTITGIARNPLLRAVVEYGRRSMGDQLRFDSTQPRELTDTDLRADKQPKVVVNPPEMRVTAPARFAPPVEAEQLARVTAALDRRSGTQRGKPRSRDQASNPLGCRVFDCACGWPMYRQPYNGSFRYSCGLYQQSHGAKCTHNTLDGVQATRLVLGCVRQRVLGIGPGLRERLRVKLEELARRDQSRPDPVQEERRGLERSLTEARQNRERAEQNLGRATSDEQYQAVSRSFEQFLREERELEGRLESLNSATEQVQDGASQVEAALSAFDRLAELAGEPTNLAAIGELFTRLNARLFLRFGVSNWGKRKVNRVSSGTVTFGATEPPVALYEGPTGRRSLAGRSDSQADGMLCISESKQDPQVPGREGDSLGNVSRAESRLTSGQLAGVHQLIQRADCPIVGEDRSAEAVRYAMEHLTYRKSQLDQREVVLEALRFDPTAVTPANVMKEIGGPGIIRREQNGVTTITSAKAVNQEKAILHAAVSGRGRCRAFVDRVDLDLFDRKPTRGQFNAVEHLLTSPDKVMVWVGKAGAGKSTALKAAKRHLDLVGVPMQVIAPTIGASRDGDLRHEFPDIDTATAFLRSEEMQKRLRGGLLVIDEITMLGVQSFAEISQSADRYGYRVLVVGDDKQHRAPVRGDVLGLLKDKTGIPVVEMNEILRQRGKYAEASAAASRHETLKALGIMEEMDWVTEGPADKMIDASAVAYLDCLRSGETAVICSPTHRQGEKVVAAVRQKLREADMLTGPDHEFRQLVPLYMSPPQLEEAKKNPEPGVVYQRYEAYLPGKISLAVGDSIRLLGGGTGADGKKLENGWVGTVTGFRDGNIEALSEDGRTKRLIGSDFGKFQHAYYTTSLGVQSKTRNVSIMPQTADAYAAMGARQFYVDMSRGDRRAIVLTDSLEKLRQVIQRADERPHAMDLVREPKKGIRQRLRKHLSFLRSIANRGMDKALGREPERELIYGRE